MSHPHARLVETDEAGNVVAVYVPSTSNEQSEETRVDVIVSTDPYGA